MAHARRKFFDSLPKDKARESDANSVTRQGIHYCDQMFSLERSWKDLSAEERYKKRQSELKPLLKKFSDWCYKKSVSVLPSGKLGAAFQYCLNLMDKFMNILKETVQQQSKQSKRSSWDARTGSFHRAALAPKPCPSLWAYSKLPSKMAWINSNISTIFWTSCPMSRPY